MERPLCNLCKTTPVAKKGIKDGVVFYRAKCWFCCRTPEFLRKHNSREFRMDGYRKHKKDSCEKCGFKAQHRVQLDVDHIDGNHANNTQENLQTLCANCHRLKTQLTRVVKRRVV